MSTPSAVPGPAPRQDLRDISEDEIFGELRRRNINSYQVRQQLGIRQTLMDDPNNRLKFIALVILGAIAAGLILVIAILSVEDKMVSSVISGLAGSAIGAIAGILVGSTTPGPTIAPGQQSPPRP